MAPLVSSCNSVRILETLYSIMGRGGRILEIGKAAAKLSRNSQELLLLAF
jgi:hypothetical protein